MKIKVYDTTLRDGSQSPKANFSVHDKIKLLQVLDDYGVDYVELGWPHASEDERKAFEEAKKVKLKNAKLAAFGSTRKKNIKAEDDDNLNAIVNSGATVGTIFGKTWLMHIEGQLKTTPKQNIEAIADSVRYLKSRGLEVIYDAEHFFSGFKENENYALATLKTAFEAGATTLVLCDTKGGVLTQEMRKTVERVNRFMIDQGITAHLGIHGHNDSGVAVANTLEAVLSGVSHIQGTINGIGERCGNADLCSILPNLILKLDYKSEIKLDQTKKVSGIVATLSGARVDTTHPYVGKDAFSHKGGIHADGVRKMGGKAYEHISPDLMGNTSNILLSDQAGRSNVLMIAEKVGFKDVNPKDPRALEARKECETMFNIGYNLSLKAEGYLLMQKYFGNNMSLFNISGWKVMSEDRGGEYSECVITGNVDGEEYNVVAPLPKRGPVDAIYNALVELISKNYPGIKDVSLQNYKVRMAKEQEEKSPVVAYIEFKNHKEEWATEGLSTNILEASLEAIEKGFRYYLLKSVEDKK